MQKMLRALGEARTPDFAVCLCVDPPPSPGLVSEGFGLGSLTDIQTCVGVMRRLMSQSGPSPPSFQGPRHVPEQVPSGEAHGPCPQPGVPPASQHRTVQSVPGWRCGYKGSPSARSFRGRGASCRRWLSDWTFFLKKSFPYFYLGLFQWIRL